MPGIFNLGGDLRHFAELIRSKDRNTLRQYAHACIDVQHPRAVKMNLPIVSISLVQGDALGGGFEAALADDVIIAEKSAKFGLPECLFNLFPGMGALSFLTRKIGAPLAEKMVFSGKIYYGNANCMRWAWSTCWPKTGMGEQAVYDFVEKTERSFASRRSVYASRQIINPVSREELVRITDMWVEAALTLTPMDRARWSVWRRPRIVAGPRSTRWRRPSNGGGWRAEYRALSPLQRSAGRAIVSARRRAQARPLAAALPPAGHGRGRRTGGCRTIDPWSALWGDPQGEVRGAAGYQRGRQDRPQPIWLQKMGSRGNLPPRGCFPQGQSLQGSRRCAGDCVRTEEAAWPLQARRRCVPGRVHKGLDTR